MLHDETQAFSELVAALYHGPFETPRWDSFLKLLLTMCDGCHAAIGMGRPTASHSGAVFGMGKDGFDYKHLERFADFTMLDSFVDLPIGEAVTMHQTIPQAELEQSPFYTDLLLGYNIKFVLGLDTYKEQREAIFVRVLRPIDAEDFGDREKALLTGLHPHIENLVLWLDQYEEVNSERSIYESVVSQLALGTVLIGPKGTIEKMNPVAQYLLELGDGLCIEQGRVTCQAPALNRSLQQLITQAEVKQRPRLAGTLTVPRTHFRTPLYLTIKPHGTSEFTGDMIAAHNMLFINASEMQVSGSQDALRDMLGLTKAEARLAIEMANGLTLNESAEKLHITSNTARTHLSRIYQKAEINNQTAMVSTVLRCIASLSDPPASL